MAWELKAIEIGSKKLDAQVSMGESPPAIVTVSADSKLIE